MHSPKNVLCVCVCVCMRVVLRAGLRCRDPMSGISSMSPTWEVALWCIIGRGSADAALGGKSLPMRFITYSATENCTQSLHMPILKIGDWLIPICGTYGDAKHGVVLFRSPPHLIIVKSRMCQNTGHQTGLEHASFGSVCRCCQYICATSSL